jgi:pimeloyl-ACP methyl ester carboxylesterase
MNRSLFIPLVIIVVPPGFDTIHISYPVPEKREDLQTFAFRFIPQIDTTAPFILVGVSLGGMTGTELTDTLCPVGTMLKEKDPLYLKRTVDMIIQWDRTTHPDRIIHIHGNKDHTIPVKNVKVDYLVEGGSHMMMLTRADEIKALLGPILHNQWQ